MRRTLISLAVVALAFVGCSEGDEETADPDEPTTTTTLFESTDSELLDTCITAVFQGAEGIDLASSDAGTQLTDRFVDGLPTQCDFLTAEGAASTGLSDEEIIERLERALPASLFEFLSEPRPAPFTDTADEL